MRKAKVTSKEPAKKPAKRSARKEKKPKDLAEARKDITEIVRGEATDMAKAVVVEALKGQLAHMKYLFEVSGLYPVNLGTEAKPGEDSLALALMKRMGLPVQPAISQDDDINGKQGSEARTPESEELGEKGSGEKSESEAGDTGGQNSGQDAAVGLS